MEITYLPNNQKRQGTTKNDKKIFKIQSQNAQFWFGISKTILKFSCLNIKKFTDLPPKMPCDGRKRQKSLEIPDQNAYV